MPRRLRRLTEDARIIDRPQHGERVASIDALPEIAEAIGERATLYGTAVGGQAGAFRAADLIRREFDTTMAYCGCNTVDEITPDILFGLRGRNSMADMVGA